MSSRFEVVPTRIVVALIALTCALCLCGTFAAAQNNQPKDEVFGGYSWEHTGGYVDNGFKSPDIADGFDVSNTYYLPQMHNLGILADFSYNFNGKIAGTGVNNIDVYNVLGGLQYKFHGETFSPFGRVLIGGVYHTGGRNGSGVGYRSQWSVGAGAGGGFDINLSQLFTLRIAQVDYIYNTYSP
jgi:hypothetical protein